MLFDLRLYVSWPTLSSVGAMLVLSQNGRIIGSFFTVNVHCSLFLSKTSEENVAIANSFVLVALSLHFCTVAVKDITAMC